MYTKSNRLNVFIRRQGILAAALLASVMVLGACSSSSDSSGNAGTTVTAFNFDASNSQLGAEIAASAIDFFNGFTQIGIQVINILVNQSPSGSPFPLLSVCMTGTAVLTWNDNGDGVLSVGDSATLTFTNCDTGGDTVNGTVTITATSVDLLNVPQSLAYNVAVNLTISGVDTSTIVANFSATTSTSDGGNSFTNVYTAADVAGQTATLSQNGTEYYRMGCFSVTQMFTAIEITTGSLDMLPSPSGVIVASNKAMSLQAGAQLTFIDDSMELGTQTVLSMSVPNCASVGVPNGVADSNGSYLEMEATGGGNITVNTFDASNTVINTIMTTWQALTD